MKKVFALVLALAMMMVATTAWAKEKEFTEAGGDAEVKAKYSVSDTVSISVSWTDPTTVFAYQWSPNEKKWTTSVSAQTVQFDITNGGASNKTVTMAHTTAEAPTWLTVAASGEETKTVPAGATGNTASISYSLTPAAAVDTMTVTGDTEQSLTFSVTIGNPAA